MSHEHRHLIAEPPVSEPYPVVSSIKEVQLQAKTVTGYVQRCLVVRIVLREPCIRQNEPFRFAEPLLMAITIQDHKPCVEILTYGNFPVPRCVDMQRTCTLRYSHQGLSVLKTFWIPRV